MATKVLNLLNMNELDLNSITRNALKELLESCNCLGIEVICYTYTTGRPMFQMRGNGSKTKMHPLTHQNVEVFTDAVKVTGAFTKQAKDSAGSRPINDVGIREKLQELHELAVRANGEFTWNTDGDEVTYGRPLELSWKTAYDAKYPHVGPSCRFKIPEQIELAEKFVRHDWDVLDR